MDRFPLGSGGREVYRDPAEITSVRPVKSLVQRGCVGDDRLRHLVDNDVGAARWMLVPQVNSLALIRDFSIGRYIQRGAGAVVARMHSGRGMGFGLDFVRRGDWSDYRFQFRPRDSTQTKQDRSLFGQSRCVQSRLGKREHGGFDADLTGSAVEYEVHVRTQAPADVLSGRRRKFGEAVGAGCSEWNTGSTDEGERDGMPGHAQTNRGEIGGDDVRNDGLLFQYQGQRAGPESAGQALSDFWPVGNQRLRHFDRGYVDDEGAGTGSAFNGVDPGCRFSIEGISAKTVNSFSGEGDEPAGAQKLGGAVDFAGSGDLEHR